MKHRALNRAPLKDPSEGPYQRDCSPDVSVFFGSRSVYSLYIPYIHICFLHILHMFPLCVSYFIPSTDSEDKSLSQNHVYIFSDVMPPTFINNISF